MRALVTGATGFLGCHLVAHLLSQGDAVAVILRPDANPWRLGPMLSTVSQIRGNLRHVARLRPAIAAFDPEVVFHLAWWGVSASGRQQVRQVTENLVPSVELATVATDLGVGTFVGIGSQAEYGRRPGPVDETCSTVPETMYGAVKVGTYLALKQIFADSDVRFAWLRLFSSYGPKDNPQALIPYVARTLLEGQVPALTNGEQVWNYTYVKDVVKGIYAVARVHQARGLFNLGSGQTTIIRGVVELIRDMINPSLPLGFGQRPYATGQVMHLEPDISRIQTTTGWAPTTSLETGLLETIHYYSSLHKL
jgi:UDP-glucose 4-epimerase